MAERSDVSLVTELDTMLGTVTNDFLRVELQAMDAKYPLYGNLVLQPDQLLADATAFDNGHWGVAIDPVLAERLDISIGETTFTSVRSQCVFARSSCNSRIARSAPSGAARPYC